MPLYTADALVLRTYKLGEADRIVVFLTRDRGKKRGVARGARRPRSPFVGALEPLTRATVAYFEKESRELVSLNYAEAVRSPLAASSGAALGLVSYFAELIDEVAPEANPDERLFRLGAVALEGLTDGAPIPALARYFELWLLRLQGVYPSVDRCQRCGRGLVEGAWLVKPEAVFACRDCQPGRGRADLSPRSLEWLRQARSLTPLSLAGAVLDADGAREIEMAHRTLIALHLDREPRSVRVLREIDA